MQFKDVPINSYFSIKDNDKTISFKKIDYNSAKDIWSFTIKEFNLYDEIIVEQDSKFKLNY